LRQSFDNNQFGVGFGVAFLWERRHRKTPEKDTLIKNRLDCKLILRSFLVWCVFFVFCVCFFGFQKKPLILQLKKVSFSHLLNFVFFFDLLLWVENSSSKRFAYRVNLFLLNQVSLFDERKCNSNVMLGISQVQFMDGTRLIKEGLFWYAYFD